MSPRTRLPGIGYAVFLPVFALSGLLLEPAQPVAGLLAGAATAVLALRLPRAFPGPDE